MESNNEKGISVDSRISIAVINTNIETIKSDITEIKGDIKELTGTFLSRTEFMDFKQGEFATIKRAVYGAVGVILLAVMGGIMTLILK